MQLRAACQRAEVLYLTHGRVYDLSRSDDIFMMGFEFLRAEADANTMRERQLRTVRLNAEKGRPHGRLAYGCWPGRACGRWRCGCRTRVSRPDAPLV